jgi:hypothetical protein
MMMIMMMIFHRVGTSCYLSALSPLFDPRSSTFHLCTVVLTKKFFSFHHKIVDNVFIYAELFHVHLCAGILMIRGHYHFCFYPWHWRSLLQNASNENAQMC